MASPSWAVLRAKLRIADNHLRNIKRHIWVHVLLGLSIAAVLLFLGTALFYWTFEFLLGQEVFGPPLVERLLGMVLMAFFSMLVFSNLIITLTTTYISKEVEFLMGHPLAYRQIFSVKLCESIFYSSWAFALLSLPIFVAYGAARHVGLKFYGGTVLLIIPFTIIPGALGALITMVLSAFFPARKTRTLSAALFIVIIMMTILMVRLVGGRQFMLQTGDVDFERIMSYLTVGSIPIFPNYWFAQGTLALADGRWGDFFYWFAMLASTAMMVVQACLWLIGPLYYRGWSLSRESSKVEVTKGRSVIDRIGAWLPLGRSDRAILVKDLKTFCRDPAQWTQLIIVFSMLAIYVVCLRQAVRSTAAIDMLLPKWRMILSFLTIGGTCFILSIVTTRFSYPMLSLEGRQYWIIGLAPVARTRLVWEKFILTWLVSFILAEALMVLSNFLIDTGTGILWLSVTTVLLVSLGLSSLSIGLGAMTPNFKEDNPARIANGLGGTINVVLSLIYIGLVVALSIPLGARAVLGNMYESGGFMGRVVLLSILGLAVVHAAVIILPMYFGLRRWRRIEF
jgi:ABC-2 type transport system permease protein